MATVNPSTGTGKFRILSLDGGGIKGAYTASVLATLEETTGCRAVEHFDLITGTSTGGILAIGLGLGFPARVLCDFYLERGPTIFPSTGRKRRWGWLRQLLGPKHDHEVLRDALRAIMGERKLVESRCRLVIPTYDAIRGHIFIMKTPHYPRFTHDAGAFAYDVALATSAAPTYFQAADFPHHGDASYVDGGVWANCPALVGVTEAIAFLGRQPGGIDVLSIGTTSTPFNISKQRSAGAAQWNVGIIELMFEAQVEAARAQAALIAGAGDSERGLFRIDAKVMKGQYELDRADERTIKDLIAQGRGDAVMKVNQEAVRTRFLNGVKAAPYHPQI